MGKVVETHIRFRDVTDICFHIRVLLRRSQRSLRAEGPCQRLELHVNLISCNFRTPNVAIGQVRDEVHVLLVLAHKVGRDGDSFSLKPRSVASFSLTLCMY